MRKTVVDPAIADHDGRIVKPWVRKDEAQEAIDRLTAYIPGFTLKAVRKNPMLSDPAFVEKLLDSLSLAGLQE